MKVLILYASLTGNTEGIAKVIADVISQNHYVRRIHIESANDDLKNEIQNSDVVGLGYWVDKGTANKAIMDLKKELMGKPCFLFGTIGASPNSEHALQSTQSIMTHFNECCVLGHFLCRGKIDPKITEMLKKLPEGHMHSMTEERMKRHVEAANHPNETDFENALKFANEMVIKI